MFSYNWLVLQRYTIAAPEPLPAGKAVVRFSFDYDGGGVGKGGTGHLFTGTIGKAVVDLGPSKPGDREKAAGAQAEAAAARALRD